MFKPKFDIFRTNLPGGSKKNWQIFFFGGGQIQAYIGKKGLRFWYNFNWQNYPDQDKKQSSLSFWFLRYSAVKLSTFSKNKFYIPCPL